MKKLVFVIIGLLFTVSVSADQIVRKNLGDINGDGKKEVAVEITTFGASSFSTEIKIKSGDKTIFVLPGFSGDTAGGYKIIDKQVVVWKADWISVQSKWEPHYYDFYWYSWNEGKHRFVQCKEGFTRHAYTVEKAKKLMPKLAQKLGGQVVKSKNESFERDALNAASRKYGRRFTKAKRATIPGFSAQGRSYNIESFNWAYVNFNRDGSVEIDTM